MVEGKEGGKDRGREKRRERGRKKKERKNKDREEKEGTTWKGYNLQHFSLNSTFP